MVGTSVGGGKMETNGTDRGGGAGLDAKCASTCKAACCAACCARSCRLYRIESADGGVVVRGDGGWDKGRHARDK